MKKYDWKIAAELIGIIAIVASLVFVGLQLKQSQEIATAEQYQNRADAALELYVARMQSDDAIATLAYDLKNEIESGRAFSALKGTLEKDGAEFLATRYLWYRANITLFDNHYFQYEQGFLTEAARQAFLVRVKGLLSGEAFAAFYVEERSGFRQSFEDLCDDIFTELKARSAAYAA